MEHDDDPTPPDRPSALDSALRRARVQVGGGPAVYVVERPSRRMDAVEDPVGTDESTLGSLERVINDVIDRRTARSIRRLKAGIVTALIAAIGALGGGVKSALDARETAGVDKTRLRQLEVEVDRLRSAVFPPPPYWRRDDSPMLQPAAPQMRVPDPAQRGPLP